VISANRGESWSNWYNQSTAAMYHVTADNAFPYRLCSGQQDSGSACVDSRGMDGQITFHDWHPVGIEEYGEAAPDPKNPNLVYGGKVTVYNRLTAQKLAETSATLNDAGVYQTSGGTWSDVFTYDERSNLTSRTDARGVKTVYDYNSDPLNRLQSVSWDTSGFGDAANPILSAATVSYQYRTKSSGSQLLDIAQLSSVTTSGVSTEGYSYDSEGRISSKTLTLTSRPSYPFVTDYIFDALDHITDVRYPAEYGNGTQPRKLVHQD